MSTNISPPLLCRGGVWERSDPGGGVLLNFTIQKNHLLLKQKMSRLHNRKNLKFIWKHLRNKSTSAEATLWKMLKKSQVGGYKFRRQHSIESFVVDFYCPALKLAIELDGEPHADLQKIIRDSDRDEKMEQHGNTVKRYENRWVFEYPEVIVQDILEFGEKKKNTGK